MKKLFVISGVSGAGKSTLVEKLITNLLSVCGCKRENAVAICSTDNYWIRPDGQYDWNFKLMGDAHKWNQKMTEIAMMNGKPYVIIDNTNLTFQEIKPYLNLAKDYGYQVEIIEPQTEWRYDAEVLAKRNAHQVPLVTIEKMLARKEPLEQLQCKVKEFMDA